MKTDFAKYAIVGLLVAGLMALTAPTAQAASGGVGASVTVAAAVFVQSDAPMAWGTLAKPDAGTTLFSMNPTGTVTKVSGEGAVVSGPTAVAEFTVKAAAGTGIDLSVNGTAFTDGAVTFQRLEIVSAGGVVGGTPGLPATGTIASSAGATTGD